MTVVDAQTGARQEGVVWGAQSAPWTVSCGGRDYAIDLRHERYPMPFTLEQRSSPRSTTRHRAAQSFSSDVKVLEGSSERAVRISMNEPLRTKAWSCTRPRGGPSTRRRCAPLFSTFAVVRNPADHYPLYACIVIALGLVLHFSRKARPSRSSGRTAHMSRIPRLLLLALPAPRCR
jgi:hypothetical protein